METREQESHTRIWARSSARFYHLWLYFLDRMGYGRMIRQAIEEVPNPVRRILDIGTGTGAAVRIAKEIYPISEALGIDLSSQFLEEAKRVSKSTEIQYVQASAGSLPFRSGVFDLATSFGVICHTADPRRVVQEMIRSLSPGAMPYYGPGTTDRWAGSSSSSFPSSTMLDFSSTLTLIWSAFIETRDA